MIVKLNDRVKENLGVAIILLMLMMSLMIPVFVSDSFSMVVMAGTGLFCLFGLLFFELDRLNSKRFKFRYLIPLLVFGGSFLINGFYFGVIGYIAIGIVFCVILPIMQKIMSGSSHGDIAYSISKGITYGFVVFYVVSVLFGPPLGKDQYFSFLANPNIIGGLASITVASVLNIILHKKEEKNRNVWAYIFVLGLAIAMCFFSNSRTNMLAVIIQLAIVCVIEGVKLIRTFNKQKVGDYAKTIVAIVLIIVLAFGFFFCSLTFVKQVISPFTFVNIAFKDSLEISGDRFGKGLEGKDVFAFTSGRTAIWSDYIENISLLGHSSESRDIDTGTRVMENTNAHNVYIQSAYSAGLLAGIAVFIYVAIMGIELLINGLAFIFKGKELSLDKIYLITAYFAFGIASLTSAGYMMFTYLPATLFWILTYAISFKRE
ncbi:MAG: O-antigen ligase family protein [Firmicutes bacterium]|nr:O-antigen ligase family protein [Bacillota bacterium]